jgi:hypothetical protein
MHNIGHKMLHVEDVGDSQIHLERKAYVVVYVVTKIK